MKRLKTTGLDHRVQFGDLQVHGLPDVLRQLHDKKHSNETELSKYIWDLKKGRRNFSLKWSILVRATAYQSEAKQCNLWLMDIAMLSVI